MCTTIPGSFGVGGQTQGLMYARQTLCQLSNLPSPVAIYMIWGEPFSTGLIDFFISVHRGRSSSGLDGLCEAGKLQTGPAPVCC